VNAEAKANMNARTEKNQQKDLLVTLPYLQMEKKTGMEFLQVFLHSQDQQRGIIPIFKPRITSHRLI
jgi:hypothetical protein